MAAHAPWQRLTALRSSFKLNWPPPPPPHLFRALVGTKQSKPFLPLPFTYLTRPKINLENAAPAVDCGNVKGGGGTRGAVCTPNPFISQSRVFTFCSLEFRISSCVSPFGGRLFSPLVFARIRENYYRPFVLTCVLTVDIFENGRCSSHAGT